MFLEAGSLGAGWFFSHINTWKRDGIRCHAWGQHNPGQVRQDFQKGIDVGIFLLWYWHSFKTFIFTHLDTVLLPARVGELAQTGGLARQFILGAWAHSNSNKTAIGTLTMYASGRQCFLHIVCKSSVSFFFLFLFVVFCCCFFFFFLATRSITLLNDTPMMQPYQQTSKANISRNVENVQRS